MVQFSVIDPETTTRKINEDATYSFVLLGDRENLDGTKDFVVRLKGTELKHFIELVRER